MLDYTNLFPPNDCEKNDTAYWKNYTALFAVSIENLKNKISYILEKAVLSIIFSICKNEDEKIFKAKESIDIAKILGLIENKKLLLKL